MNRTMGWRMTSAVLVAALMVSMVQAQQPTVVLSIRGIAPLIDDAEFVAGEAGQDGAKEGIEDAINGFTGGKGLAGIDQTKPLGLYWNATGSGMPVVFLPITDADDLKGLLTDLTPDFKDSKGQWTMTVNGTKLFAKVSGKYCFVSNDASTLTKLADPAKIVNTKYDVALEASISSLPEELKNVFLTQFEASARQSMENGPEPGEGEKEIRDAIFEGMLASTKSFVNDGDRVTFGFDIDEKTRLGALDFSVTGKTGTTMAKSLTAFGKTQPLFAGIGSDTAPLRMVVSYPTTGIGEEFDAILKAAQEKANAEIDESEKLKEDDDRATAKKLLDRVFSVVKATVKAGSMHSGFVLDKGSDDTVQIVGGMTVAKGDEVAKLIDDAIKLSKDNPDLVTVKIDADKHAGARIHAVTPDEDEEYEKMFGKSDAHFAVRTDSIWLAMGGGNLKGLKKALDQTAKPATPKTPLAPISFQVKPAALTLLMEKDDEGLIERAKAVAGKPGDKLNIEVVPVTSGAKLRIEFGVDLLQLAETPN